MAMSCCSVFQDDPSPRFLCSIPLTLYFQPPPPGRPWGRNSGVSTKGPTSLGSPVPRRHGRRARHWVRLPLAPPWVQGLENSSHCWDEAGEGSKLGVLGS